MRTPVAFANEGARAQWRGVAAPSSGDLGAGLVENKSFENGLVEPVHEPQKIVCHQAA